MSHFTFRSHTNPEKHYTHTHSLIRLNDISQRSRLNSDIACSCLKHFQTHIILLGLGGLVRQDRDIIPRYLTSFPSTPSIYIFHFPVFCATSSSLGHSVCLLVCRSVDKNSPFLGGHSFRPRGLKFGMKVKCVCFTVCVCVQADGVKGGVAKEVA